MKTKTRFSLLLALLYFLASVIHITAQSAAFTYQGRLTSGGGPANGRYDFQFTLFDAENDGSPVGDPITFSAMGLTNGLFTASLDYDTSVFAGQDR
ncbi:MAG TPA: hypothetical protein PLX89_26405 [Verrucomicrobiota bacterium]|nr:hypothetical protein [Verrucomicrobiales bacterium]HRI16541.1 hypothetical protein [Verrucomicrobiota bacterium]